MAKARIKVTAEFMFGGAGRISFNPGAPSCALSLLFGCVLLCSMLRGAFSGESASAPPVPAQWTLLVSNPKLWAAPEGERTETVLDLEPGAAVPVSARANGTAEPKIVWLEVQSGTAKGWLPEALLAPPAKAPDPIALGGIGAEVIDRDHGISPAYAPPDLVDIESGYIDGYKYRLRKQAAAACIRLIRAAREDGVDLWIMSGYRPWEKQRELYLARIEKSGFGQTTVAKPGHSEHQLGTAVDFTDGDLETQLRVGFGETEAGKWLARRAPEFGFAVSYTAANAAQTGYAPEPWHYRYFGLDEAPRRHAAALGQAAP